jgi:hypothetical protein
VLVLFFAHVVRALILVSRLVALQSLVADTQASLNNVVESIDELLNKDEVFPLVSVCTTFVAILLIFSKRRDISERESRIREWRKNHCVVLDQIAQRLYPSRF